MSDWVAIQCLIPTHTLKGLQINAIVFLDAVGPLFIHTHAIFIAFLRLVFNAGGQSGPR